MESNIQLSELKAIEKATGKKIVFYDTNIENDYDEIKGEFLKCLKDKETIYIFSGCSLVENMNRTRSNYINLKLDFPDNYYFSPNSLRMDMEMKFLNPIKAKMAYRSDDDSETINVIDQHDNILALNILNIHTEFSVRQLDLVLYALLKTGKLSEESYLKLFPKDESIFNIMNDTYKNDRLVRITDNENIISSELINVDMLKDQLKAREINLKNKEMELKALKETISYEDSYFTKQIEDIKKMDFVKEIRFENGNMTVDFKTVELIDSNDGKVYNFGEYELNISKTARNVLDIKGFSKLLKGVKVKYMEDNEIADNLLKQHPHIDEGGNICFGNLGNDFDNSVKLGNIVAIISLYWELLHNYKRRDGFIKIKTFNNIYQKILNNLPCYIIDSNKDENGNILCPSCEVYVSESDICSSCDSCSEMCCNCDGEDDDNDNE